MRDAESLLDQVLAYAGDRITLEAVREAVGLADDAAITALLHAYVAGDAPAALDQIEALADGGRDMAQVAAQAEGEARQMLLLAAADPPAARRLATILRTLAEAAGEGAHEGRARLAMELLAVEQAFARDRPRAAAREPKPGTGPASRRGARRRSSPPPAPEPVAAATPPRPSRRVRSRSPRPSRPTAAGGWSGDAAARRRGRHPRPLGRGRRQLPARRFRPLLSECRPVALDGARLTLAFPEERGFMREKVTNRAGSIEQLLATVLGGSWAVDCIASNVELEPLTVAAGRRMRMPAIRTARPCWMASCASPAVSWSTRRRSADLVSIHAAPRAGFASQS